MSWVHEDQEGYEQCLRDGVVLKYAGKQIMHNDELKHLDGFLRYVQEEYCRAFADLEIDAAIEIESAVADYQIRKAGI